MNRHYGSRSTFGGFSLAALLCAASTSTLLADVPTMSAHIVGAEGGKVIFTPTLNDFHTDSDGMQVLNAPVVYENLWGANATTWTIEELKYDIDPIVYNNQIFFNNSAVSQSYVVTVTLPTTWPSPNSIRGSIDTSIIGTDTTISAPPLGAIYSALIDGVTVQTLQDAPFSLGTTQSATSDYVDFGYDLSNIAVGSSIGIRLQFTLSPGDTAAILSDFEVVDVIPEPGTLSLLLLGVGALVWRRRS
jgi:hypothetical protein